VITLDSSALFALLNRGDPGHAAVREVLARDRGPHIVPAGILAETAYLVETRYGVRVMDSLLGDLEAGVFTLDCGDATSAGSARWPTATPTCRSASRTPPWSRAPSATAGLC
jgi:predicted nucleic acid-binding protein